MQSLGNDGYRFVWFSEMTTKLRKIYRVYFLSAFCEIQLASIMNYFSHKIFYIEFVIPWLLS